MSACDKYEENPYVCYDNGEPKGQCLNCGYDEDDHEKDYKRKTPLQKISYRLFLRESLDGPNNPKEDIDIKMTREEWEEIQTEFKNYTNLVKSLQFIKGCIK